MAVACSSVGRGSEMIKTCKIGETVAQDSVEDLWHDSLHSKIRP